MDETFIGAVKPGKRGRGAAGKVLVVGAIERAPKSRRGFGRARLAIAQNAKSKALREFITANIAPGSTVVTDAWTFYPAIVKDGFEHKPINVKRSGQHAHEVLPGVHRVASLLKRWLNGTLQGCVAPNHLQAYLDEFVFRFNRRHAAQRGLRFYRLLEQAVRTPPGTYHELVAVPRPKTVMPIPPGKRQKPGSLAIEPLRSALARILKAPRTHKTTAITWISLFAKWPFHLGAVG